MLIYRTSGSDKLTMPHGSLGLNKFPSDNFFADYFFNAKKDITIFSEGYFLNDGILRKQYGIAENEETGDKENDRLIEHIYLNEPEKLYSCFKGSYAIAIYDKPADRLTVINDLLSKKTMYYLKQPAGSVELCVSTSFMELCDTLRENGVTPTVSAEGVMSMLNNSQMLFDVTYAEEIGYLMPFESLVIEKGVVSIRKLPYPKTDDSITSEQAVEHADKLFMEGCRLALEKNRDGGYITACSLSGGMDSRAVFLTAKRLGYLPDLCFTYAQSGSLDETIPQRIASDNGCPHLFLALDGGKFMTERDFAINANEGQLIYSGTTGLPRVVQALDANRIGILLAGFGGGEIMGDILSAMTKEQEPDFFRKKAETLSLPGQPADEQLLKRMTEGYDSFHQFANLNDTRLCVNFPRIAGSRFEVMSPFLYEDFFCYMLTVPSGLKRNRRLYNIWYAEKMPNSYPTTGNIRLDRRETKLAYIYRKLYSRHVYRRQLKTNGHTKYDMNPFSRWDSEDPSLTAAVRELYAQDMKKLGDMIPPALRAAMDGCMEKDIVAKEAAATASWALRRMLLGN